MSAISTATASRVEVIGIRHHGPGSARSVLRALDELAPEAVLVEFPADAAPLLPWVRSGLVPPVALLGHLADDPGRAAFLPLATFSPEWQAFAWAQGRGIELRPIDLPLSTVLAVPDARDVHGVALVDDPIAQLAAAAGDPEPERWWEDVVEHRGDGTPAFAAIAAAMAALRPDPLSTASDLEARREAHMRDAVRVALRDGHERIAVVCGAWHVPALDVALTTATADRSMLAGAPRAKVAMSWIPWTHERLATSTGYGAGVESPGWYAHVFAHPGPDGVARFLVDAARHLRRAGFETSPDHLIGATRLADGLAALRGRPRAGLSEVLDAADSVFADRHRLGLPGGVLLRRDLVVGDALGEVPDSAPQVPLARDLAATQRRCRLRPVAGARTVELDLRTPNGRARSQLLHRTAIIGLRWGELVDGRGSSGTFRETWELHPEPEDAVRIVEASPYGTTLVAAATARAVELARTTPTLAALHGVLEAALLADLPAAIGGCLEAMRTRAALGSHLGELIDALGPLAATVRYGDVRDTDRRAVREVFDDFVARSLAAMPTQFGRATGEEAATAARRVAVVHAALMLDAAESRRETWRRVAESLTGAASGLIAGRATRVLHDAGWWESNEVERRLSRALSTAADPSVGAEFVEGFLAGSGTVLLHDAELLGLVDRWLTGLRGDAFEQVVPLLRRTFGAFDPAERRRIGWALTDRTAEATLLGGLDAARLAVAARLAGRLLGVPGDDIDRERG